MMFKKKQYPPSTKSSSPWVFTASILFFLLGLGFLCLSHSRGWLDSVSGSSPQAFFEKKIVTDARYNDILVTWVIDGDTVELENKQHVRLIGIDAPESRENDKAFRDSRRTGMDIKKIIVMGNKAKDFVKDLVENKRVRLEFDVETKDKYGRLLAYVYLKATPEVFVNALIMKMGYAVPMSIPPNVKFAKELHDLYAEARAQKRGLWKKEKLLHKTRN